MDKDSRARWLRDCEQCQGDTKKVLKILRGGVQLARKENLTLIQKVQLLLYKGLNNYYNRILHGIEIPLCTEIGAGLRLVHMNGIYCNSVWNIFCYNSICSNFNIISNFYIA